MCETHDLMTLTKVIRSALLEWIFLFWGGGGLRVGVGASGLRTFSASSHLQLVVGASVQVWFWFSAH